MLEAFSTPPIAVTFESFTDVAFWTGVGIIAGTYTIFALGLQLNVGFTGIFNFGQAAFMAIGAYAMAILTTDTGISFWLSLPIAVLIAIAFGLVVGLPSLRLRTRSRAGSPASAGPTCQTCSRSSSSSGRSPSR